MKIVHLLEKVDVDHDEDQVAMIQFSRVAAADALIISQNLPGFRCQNLF